MSSFMTIKKSAGRLTQVAARRIACYSTEVPTPNTSNGAAAPAAFDISAFIGRIQAIHNNQANKPTSNMDFSKIKAPAKKNGSTRGKTTEASSEQPKKFNKNFNRNRNNNGQPRKSDRPAKTEAKPTAERVNAEVKSALTDSTAEKVDLHVSSQGSRLFNNDKTSEFKSRAPRKQFTKKPFQKYDNSNNKFNRAPNSNNVKFQAKGRSFRSNNNNNRRDRNSIKNAQTKAPVSNKLTPEEALLAVRRQVSVKGSTINVASVSESTLSAFTPGIGYSGESRILRAIQQAQKASSEELRSVVESTFQGKLDGYMIPTSTKANGQESMIPVLNNNPALKPEVKNLFLNLASGKTHISSLRK
ncbi:hypothetical protein D0Z00_002318 [Geotrichum galactomycetum]|uniref:Uncharacterized protein n=1 Tax=Geotrichum galactomycetum TaxID=27317 RepID=A0ACB6V4N0_9ASCO|nr:hypothetical protein D0Z00_002318 [Geotrichum candidum]